MFDSPEVHVSKNNQFAEEFLLNIRQYYAFLETRLGEVIDLDQNQFLTLLIAQ